MEAKFFLRDPQGKAKSDPIIVLAVFDSRFKGRKCLYSTGEPYAGKWDKHKGKTGKNKRATGLPVNNDENIILREHLDKLARAVKDWGEKRRGLSSLDVKELREHLDNLGKPAIATKNDESKTLLDHWADYLASIKDTIEWRTFNSYSNSFETTPGKGKKKAVNFREFLKVKKWENLLPEQFTATHYNFYHSYLKTRVKPNTTAKRLKHLKSFLAYLVNDLKVPVGMDLNKITYRETAGLKIYLTEEHLEAYETADLPASLQKVRDLAVVQCHTCLRVSDLMRINENIDGDKIKLKTRKTDTPVEILISPVARAILKKYDNRLPEMSEQYYREGIKAIHKRLFPKQTKQVRDGKDFKTVFVHEEISSHDMVRTWITLSLQRGMPISAVAKVSGKSIATILKNYVVEDQQAADKAMEKAWGASTVLKIAR